MARLNLLEETRFEKLPVSVYPNEDIASKKVAARIAKIIRNVLFRDFEDLSKIKVKTLILWGDRDEVFPPKLAQSMNKEIPNSTLQLVNGNHDWSFFRHKELSYLIVRWLENK